MSVGGSFPREYREAQVRRLLVPGAVIKLCRVMDDGELHDKRFVVLLVEDLTITCVINSAINAFIQCRPQLLRCQVLMTRAEHEFMDRDSHVDCSHIRSYRTSEVVTDLIERPEWILGRISFGLRDQISGALQAAPTISPADVARLCAVIGHAEL